MNHNCSSFCHPDEPCTITKDGICDCITIRKVYRVAIDNVPAGGMYYRAPIKQRHKMISYPFTMKDNYFKTKKEALHYRGLLWRWLLAMRQQDIIKWNKKAKKENRKLV